MREQDGERMTITARDLTAEGKGVGRPVEGGSVVFCEDLLPGETGVCHITAVQSKYREGRCEKRLSDSPDRRAPICPDYDRCGGCSLQHLDYAAGLLAKTTRIAEALIRIGRLDPDTVRGALRPAIGMETPTHYRNHMQYPAAILPSADGTPELRIGLYGKGTHDVVPIDTCVIAHPACESIRRAVLAYFARPQTPATPSALLRRLIVRVGENTGDVMALLQWDAASPADPISGLADLPAFLAERLAADQAILLAGSSGAPALSVSPSGAPALSAPPSGAPALSAPPSGAPALDAKPWVLRSLLHARTPESGRDPARADLRPENLTVAYGSETIRERVGDREYEISPLSFFQVNTKQTRALYDTLRRMAGEAFPSDAAGCRIPEGEWPVTVDESGIVRTAIACHPAKPIPVLLDLYCGAGTIGLYLSSAAGEIVGVETAESAVRDARRNAALNHVSNTHFCAARAEDIPLSDYPAAPSLVVLDPPRKGCAPQLLEKVLALAPSSILYVSCDPATLARDLALLVPRGYALREIRPVDMFPWSGHVETVVLMSREEQTKA